MQAHAIVEVLERMGVTHVVGLPDNGSRSLFELLWQHDNIKVMLVTREGEAFAIASGLLVGGARPLVLIQNTGLLESGDAFRGTAYNMGLPLVILIGYRGYGGHREGGARVDTAATFLEPTLTAWHIPYTIATTDEDVGQIADAFERARKNLTAGCGGAWRSNGVDMLDKFACIRKLASERTDQVVVSMMSLADPWAELCDGPFDYASVDSAMGHGADFAYGVAMARPERRVIALNGDGSMLMCLGTLVTLAQYPVENFTLVIVENGTYEVTGNQPVPGHGIMDFETMARGAGLVNVHTLENEAAFDQMLGQHLQGPGLQVFVWKVTRTDQPIPKPALPIKERTHRFWKALTTPGS